MGKRPNPYTALLSEIKAFAYKVQHPHSLTMWLYPKDQLNTAWKLYDLNERVAAANQLGYDVALKATDKGLEVLYRKRVDIPYHWTY